MQARRIGVALGVVVLVAAVGLGVQQARLEPVTPVGDVDPHGPDLPAADDQSVLAQVGVGPNDLGPGWQARLMDQGDQLSQPTLDLCQLHYASESRRQARRQVVVSDSTGDPVFSTEAVLYDDQAGAAEAIAEARGAAAHCASATTVATPTTPGVDRAALTERGSEAVFLRRGRLLLGLYFVDTGTQQAQVSGTDTVATTVGTFQRRVAALPEADVR